MAITERRMTLEEFLALPERKPALEYFEGRVTRKVAPKARHARLQYKLAEWFNQFAEPRKLAVALPELRTTYGGASLVPDVAVYRWDRLPRDPSGRIVDDVFDPPDIAVEVRSPRQSRRRLVERCKWYVEHGVRLALLVDPQDESLTPFRATASEPALRGADELDCSDLIPGLRLVVQELFDSLYFR